MDLVLSMKNFIIIEEWIISQTKCSIRAQDLTFYQYLKRALRAKI